MVTKIFNNTKRAFALKSDSELKKSLFIFSMMNKGVLVSIGTKLTNLALKLHLPVEGIIKKTIFKMFCGGTSKEDCLPVIKKMHEMHVHSVLDYSSEGKEEEAEFDKALNTKTGIVTFANRRKEIPFTVFKPTGIGRFAIWEKVSAKEELTKEDQEEWDRIVDRVDEICELAYKLDMRILADAEESWMQDAADDLLEEMMSKYNQEKVIVYNTLQCYRWDRLQYIKDLHKRAKNRGFKIGAKVVRGAYMEKENARADKMGYPTPICEDKEATDVNFNAVIYYAMQNLDEIALYIGTHNEVSTYLTMQLMEEKDISKDDDRIWFSQLFGMSDHISFNLGLNGYNAAKLVPFGPIRDVIPYLMRRAQENSSVKGQTGREYALLLEEKQRREGQFTKRIA
ncbi:proline dehydrogenase family protein [Mesonia sp. K4-1]|jgi:proline dehydrogenase|uniref:proline dehydrogenase family protein n=1 Tax=Mesonia sp. K4-1 TaxID=2602760 RepID=UPI0011CB7FC4|nr:proline dehydrogenase family protein [Mesonia sp. K4-1]TXK76822.1 proline dehydrogenase [Mesonia sp. K4-1]